MIKDNKILLGKAEEKEIYAFDISYICCFGQLIAYVLHFILYSVRVLIKHNFVFLNIFIKKIT